MSSSRKDVSFQKGSMLGIKWLLTENGDKVPLHTHKDKGHISIILAGRVLVRTTGYSDLVLVAGDVVDWSAGTEHEWEAIDVPVKLLNIFLPQ